MPLIARLSSLWRNLIHRDRVEQELDDEVRAMHRLLVDEKVQAGMAPEQAARAAMLELTGVESVKQQVRDQRTGSAIDAFLKDVRYAARMLRANPGFTLVVVLSLGAGIGANTAIFSVANAVLLRTLAVPEPETLHAVRFESRLPIAPRFSYPFFEQVRAGVPPGTGIAAMSRVARAQARIGAAEPQNSLMQLVSGEFFATLRLQPQLGRLLTPEDNRQLGGHAVAVLSSAFWRRRFGSAPDAVGRELTLNGVPFTIVGVAPEGFSGAWLETPVDVWLPLAMQADVRYIGNYSASDSDPEKPWLPQDGIRWLELLVRAERSDGQERAALNAVFRPLVLREAEGITDARERNLFLDRRLTLEPYAQGSSTLRDRFRAPLVALMSMVALLLLIACANTANLLLARAASRHREMAVRLSIGASRPRVISQLLTESVLLGVLAAAAGLAIAPLASELLVRMTLGGEGPLPFSVGIDGRVLAFTAAITLVTSLLFGLAPALRATDLSLSTALKNGGRGTTGGGRTRLARVLVVSQVALSLLLVVGAGLFVRSFRNLEQLPHGFASEHVLTATINPRMGGYAETELPALYQRLIERAEALPGVQSATIAFCGLMAGCRSNSGMIVSGYTAQPGEEVGAQVNFVGPRYFSTVGMDLVAGRDFTPSENGGTAKVVIVNESMAQRYFKNGDPIGQKLGYDTADTEIVGVVRDARVNSVREAAVPMAYFPFDAAPSYYNSLDVRTTGDPRAVAASLRRAMQDLEPELPIERVTAITELARNGLRQERLISRLTMLVSALALALACLGLYGLMSYGVKQRAAELGLRLALGAPRPHVLWMVFRESLLLVGVGLALGLPLVAGASRLVGTMLFEVSPTDPATLIAAVLVLLGVGAASGYLPAWRASRVDPLTALRED